MKKDQEMDFLALVKQQWGKAGCVYCSKPAQKMCPCQTSLYCSVSCQTQDWTNHALICGKGDKREGEEQEDKRALKKKELPRMEKVVPKEILDLLIPFMEGKDLVNFSEATQAGMVAFRNYMAKRAIFDLGVIPKDTLLSLSPWVTRVKTSVDNNDILYTWPAKHLIQALYVTKPSMIAGLQYADFHNLKELWVPMVVNMNAFLTSLPPSLELLSISWSVENERIDMTGLRNLNYTRLYYTGSKRSAATVSLPGPLKTFKIFYFECKLTTFYPIENLKVVKATYDYPLTGCKSLKIESADRINYDLAHTVVETLSLTSVYIDVGAFPPTLKQLSLIACNWESLVLPQQLLSLKVEDSSGQINIPSQLEMIYLYDNNEHLILTDITTLEKCTSFSMTYNTNMAQRINQMIQALRPSVVKKLRIEHGQGWDRIIVNRLSEYTSIEELALGNVGVSLIGGDWTPPASLKILSLQTINIANTTIQRIPMLIEQILIRCNQAPKTVAAFLERPIIGNDLPFPAFERVKNSYTVNAPPRELPNLIQFMLILDHEHYTNGQWVD